jgi:serine/threonine protein kinase
VCDFGLSHTMEEAAIAAAAGSMGSVQWTAPEKLRGKPYDEKADSYSYGILL